MPITYTNRKGFTFYLCKGTTQKGKPRYFFARDAKGEPIEQIPEGYAISESVNGVVSLTKLKPTLIRPEEVAAVEAQLQRHPKAGNYRLNVKSDRIEIYERVGIDAEDLLANLKRDARTGMGLEERVLLERVHAEMDRYSQFTAVLRFILVDEAAYTFGAQRMCYLGSIDGFIDIGYSGTAEELARKLIPTLGTERFFELY